MKYMSCRWSLSHCFSVIEVVLVGWKTCVKPITTTVTLLVLFSKPISKIFKDFNFLNNYPTLSPMCITANPLKQPSRLWWAGWQPLLPSQQGKLGRESRATGVSKIIMETKLYNGHNLPPTLIGFNIWSKFDGDLFTTLSYVPAKVFLGSPRTVCFTGFLAKMVFWELFFFSQKWQWIGFS